MDATSGPVSVYDRIEYIDLLSIPNITEKEIATLLNHFDHPRRIFSTTTNELIQLGISKRLAQAVVGYRRSDELKRRIEAVEKRGVRVILRGDDEYPDWLCEWTFPPPILFLWGRIVPEDKDSIGIVGTRRATGYGRAVAELFATELARAGLTIVSGLARGIDSVAHKAALKAGGRTIAFLGCGIDIYYPRENRRLYQEIAQTGAVISEFPLGAPPWKKNFIKRNRLIPAFSRALLAVEAPEKSGVLNTVKWAVEMGKDVMVVPGSILSPRSTGTNRLLKDGAIPVTEPRDVLEYLRIPTLRERLEEVELTEEEERLLEFIGGEPIHIDELSFTIGLSPAQLSPLLLSLEMKKMIKQLPGGCYIRSFRQLCQ